MHQIATTSRETVDQPLESPAILQQLKATGVAQVIVVLRSAAAAAGVAAGASFAPDLSRYFVTSDFTQDHAIAVATGGMASVGVRDAAATAGASVALGDSVVSAAPPVRTYSNLGVMLGTVTRDGLEALRNDPQVAAVTGTPELSLIRPQERSAAKPSNEVTWGLELLDVPKLWDQGLTGKDVIVAHLDTGADGQHPALRNAFANFAEFDLLGNAISPAPAPHDTAQHGTHTAATIAGRQSGGLRMGVAPNAKLVSAIVIEGGNVVARVLGGLDWALANGARVLSMSLGFRGWWEDFIPIIQILRARGVLPVIAVGNEGPGTSRSPGNYPEVLSVGAMDQAKLVANFSSSQSFNREKKPIAPDLVAPGVAVISAVPQGRYMAMSGSSMATPHIAGLAALMLEAAPAATVDQIEDAILKSCTLGSGMTRERAGNGYPNALQAVAILTGKPLAAKVAAGGVTSGRAAKRTPAPIPNQSGMGDSRKKSKKAGPSKTGKTGKKR